MASGSDDGGRRAGREPEVVGVHELLRVLAVGGEPGVLGDVLDAEQQPLELLLVQVHVSASREVSGVGPALHGELVEAPLLVLGDAGGVVGDEQCREGSESSQQLAHGASLAPGYA